MYTLFIDTHGNNIILGLFKNGILIKNKKYSSPKGHSEYIMPLLKELLEEENINVHDLKEILVVNGPGSFTGVRLGVIIAKTLAFTLDIPIKTITSLEAIALSSDKATKKLPIIKDLKGVFSSLFSESMEKMEDYFYRTNDEFKEYIKVNKYEEYIIEEDDLDLNKIYEYMSTMDETLSHAVNPIYIKVIEALKDDKKDS